MTPAPPATPGTAKRRARDDGEWIRCYRALPGAAARLVCLPHAGGSASYFHALAQAMPADVEVLAVQYPGRQERRAEPLIDDIRALAAGVHAAIADWTARPTALFGHSMGASVAFEIAIRLAGEGISPLGLFASGRRAPSRYRPAEARLSDDAVLAQLTRLGGTDARLLADEELRALIIPIVRNDLRAADSYRHHPGPGLDCPVFVLVGDDDPETTADEALAWRDHTSGPFAAEVFPGGHFYLEAHAESVRSFLTGRISSLLADQAKPAR